MNHHLTMLRGRRAAALAVFTLALAGVFACPKAWADDGVFDLDTAHWMSFDHYKDAAQRGNLPPPEPVATADTAATTNAPAAPGAKLAVAPLTRPIDLPVMPGVNKGFSMQVNSTEDTRPALILPPEGSEAAPDIHLSDKNWQPPAAGQNKNSGDDADADIEKPLDVRMSFLPDNSVTPQASADHPSAAKTGRDDYRKQLQARYAVLPATTAKEPPEEKQARAALDAFHKQQLEAIQSDRATLQALQNAVHSLGLEKQLDFMAGSNGALNAQTQNVPQNSPATSGTTTVR